jgi:hypothetical protein
MRLFHWPILRPRGSGKIMDTSIETSSEMGFAASVAPEDVHCGDYIALLSVIHEYPSFLLVL